MRFTLVALFGLFLLAIKYGYTRAVTLGGASTSITNGGQRM